MNSRFLLVFAFCFAGPELSSASAQDIDSHARGLGAAKDLVQSKSRQDTLDVSPDQLAAIVRLLEKSKKFSKHRKRTFFNQVVSNSMATVEPPFFTL